MRKLILLTLFLGSFFLNAKIKSADVSISIMPDTANVIVSPEIYGQFAEHLGRCIYGGIWVGEESTVPNVKGYRTDVLNALKELKIPVLRWPGSCFADEYHWRNGIGPRGERPTMINSNWGGTVEDNSFGTHEFFDFCELIGTQPYLSANVGSGTVEEMAKWIEYITAPDGPMAREREANGRKEPWKLKYLGVGNESWGCGGSFLPEAYADAYRRYQTYCRNFGDNKLYKIASGASDYDYNWTDVLVNKVRYNMDGLSLHYYTVCDWNNKGKATEFTPKLYYHTLGKALEINDVIEEHSAIMDKYDPDRKIGLLVDEWGTWWDAEPGTNPGHLYQQNTMRDAIVAALTLDVFHRHAERLKMANIAQLANVLQAMVLTNDTTMVLTPTYHVFRMFSPHQGGIFIPLQIKSPELEVPSERSEYPRKVPMVSASATEKNGTVTMSFVNTSLDNSAKISMNITELDVKKLSSTEILTSPSITDFNDFNHPETVCVKDFKDVTVKNGTMTVELPQASIVCLQLTR